MISADSVSTVLGLIIVVAGGYYAFKGVQAKMVRENQNDLIDLLMKSKDERGNEIKEMKAQIAKLQGQVETLKTIPLRIISEEMIEIREGQKRLVDATEAILNSVNPRGRTNP